MGEFVLRTIEQKGEYIEILSNCVGTLACRPSPKDDASFPCLHMHPSICGLLSTRVIVSAKHAVEGRDELVSEQEQGSLCQI